MVIKLAPNKPLFTIDSDNKDTTEQLVILVVLKMKMQRGSQLIKKQRLSETKS